MGGAFSVSRNMWTKWANSYNQSISLIHIHTHTYYSLSLSHTHTHTPESLRNPNRIFTYYFAWSSCSCVSMLSHFSRVWFFGTPQTVACQVPVSTELASQEYWSGLPCPPQGDLPNPGIEPASLPYPALAGGFFTTNATWEALSFPYMCINLDPRQRGWQPESVESETSCN